MGAGASAAYEKCVEEVGSEALTAAYGNLAVDDKKAFRKTFKHEGLPAAIEGSSDEVKGAFADVSQENQQAFEAAMRGVIRTHTFERNNAKMQDKINNLKQRGEACEDEDKKAKMLDKVERMQEKLNERKEQGPPELSREERKANCQARRDETLEKIKEAEEAGEEKRAARLKARANRMEQWLHKFDEDSECPSDCVSCVDGSHSDCDCDFCPAEEVAAE